EKSKKAATSVGYRPWAILIPIRRIASASVRDQGTAREDSALKAFRRPAERYSCGADAGHDDPRGLSNAGSPGDGVPFIRQYVRRERAQVLCQHPGARGETTCCDHSLAGHPR